MECPSLVTGTRSPLDGSAAKTGRADRIRVHGIRVMITGPGIHSSTGKDHLGNGSGTVRLFGLSRERRNCLKPSKTLVTFHFHPHLHLLPLRVRERVER